MPENLSENAIIPNDDMPETAVTETKREKFEREQFTRRQALKKFGMTSAMATFALFSVDDLARMVGKAMEQRARDNKVATKIAKEFQQAGVALAGGPSQSEYFQIGYYCHAQQNTYPNPSHTCSGCVNAGCARYYGGPPAPAYWQCQTAANKYCD